MNPNVWLPALIVVLAGAVLAGIGVRYSRSSWLAQAMLTSARRLCGLDVRSAWIDGLRIVYLEGGHGEPLLLLHGLGADKDAFLPIARGLSRRFRVVIPDLPGFGESDRVPDTNYGVREQVARVRAFTSALGLDVFHIAGHSMGGLIAGAYAAAHADQIRSAWLLAPAAVKSASPSDLMRAIAAGQRPLPIFARDRAEARKLLAFVTTKPPLIPGVLLAHFVRQQRDNYTLNNDVAGQILAGPGLDELLAEHPTLTPALIVWGSRDRAVDVSGGQILHRLLPHSELRILSGIGHVPVLEAPATVLADYLSFRVRIESVET